MTHVHTWPCDECGEPVSFRHDFCPHCDDQHDTLCPCRAPAMPLAEALDAVLICGIELDAPVYIALSDLRDLVGGAA